MADNIGNLWQTQIPSLSEDADIQTALRYFLYGQGDPDETNPSALSQPSLAFHLQQIADDITAIEEIGIGSQISATEPTSPTEGFIWVDTSTTAPLPTLMYYQDEEPSGPITPGSLWVDKDSSPRTMYVYDSDSGWLEIGA